MHGVYHMHQYAVTEIYEISNLKILKVHNPHNAPDIIKKYLN